MLKPGFRGCFRSRYFERQVVYIGSANTKPLYYTIEINNLGIIIAKNMASMDRCISETTIITHLKKKKNKNKIRIKVK